MQTLENTRLDEYEDASGEVVYTTPINIIKLDWKLANGNPVYAFLQENVTKKLN